ncbi:MAG: membrane integrity-associated transporter subunit PqiC [Magnetococcales bacterium]|nr:membrane integrity-associated transporter subunit PqiC [Magnetococcales bacterium]
MFRTRFLKRSSLSLASLAGMLLFLSACSSPPPPREHHYRLDIPTSATPSKAKRHRFPNDVEVARFSAKGILSKREIIYTSPDQPLTLKQYNYHLWSESPATLVQELLTAYLHDSNLFKRTMTSDVRNNARYRIKGRLIRMERMTGPSPKATVEMELGLRDTKTRKLPLLKRYRQEELYQEDSVTAGTEAINRATTRIFQAFAEDLRTLRWR